MRCCSCMKEYSGEYEVCPYCGYIRGSQGEGMYYLPQGILLSKRYEIGVQINAGGFGIIYKAWDRVFNKLVAVKEYYPGGIAARTPGTKEVMVYSEKRVEEFKKGKERFLNEARTVAKFNTHPNIANVYDFFEANNTAYMIMDYMEGVSYKEYINSHNGVVDVKTAVNVTLAVLDALREVHKSKIIHRDINPSNIFICSNGVVKLIDFGAARIEETDMTTILTPHYAAPEQYQTKSIQGPFTDVYALGATLYYAVTGTKPEESIDRVLEDHLQEPSQLNPEIPKYLNNAIMRAMAVREEIRFQNTLQFRDAILNKRTVRNVEEIIKYKKKRRAAEVCAVFLALTVVVGTCFFVINNRKNKAILMETELEVWIPASDSQEVIEAKEEFDEMISEYKDNYPQIKVNVTALEKEEYEERLLEAAEDNKLPDLFDSSCLGNQYYEKMDSLEESYQLLDIDQYFYLKDYKKYFPSMRQMPLCFQLPLLSVSSVKEDLKVPEKFQSYEDLKQNGEYNYSVNLLDFKLYEDLTDKDCITRYKEVADRKGMNYIADGYKMFTNQEVPYYLTDTSEYQRMMDDIPGQFQIVLAGNKSIKGRFDHLFSVALNKPDKNRKAAKRLVYYLLSENAQDVLCVQNAEGLPLNKKMSKEYTKINQQDFSDIESYILQITFPGETENLSYKDYRKVWGN